MGTFAPADKLQIKLRSLSEAQTILAADTARDTAKLIESARQIEAYYLEADAPTLGQMPPKKN